MLLAVNKWKSINIIKAGLERIGIRIARELVYIVYICVLMKKRKMQLRCPLQQISFSDLNYTMFARILFIFFNFSFWIGKFCLNQGCLEPALVQPHVFCDGPDLILALLVAYIPVSWCLLQFPSQKCQHYIHSFQNNVFASEINFSLFLLYLSCFDVGGQNPSCVCN